MSLQQFDHVYILQILYEYRSPCRLPIHDCCVLLFEYYTWKISILHIFNSLAFMYVSSTLL